MKTRSLFKFFFGTAGLALFNSCDSIFEPSDMYGSPWAEFEIKGSVTDEDGNAVEGAVISTVEARDHHNQIVPVEEGYEWYLSTISEKNGYQSEVKEVTVEPKQIRLECTDPTGKYETMSQWADAEQTKKSKDWYQGKYTYKSDFILKKIEK